MSSGYVSTNLPRKPDRVRSPKSPVSVTVDMPGLNPDYKFTVNDFAFPNPVTTYRSGPSYERVATKPGTILGEPSWNELLARETGDFGHEFSMRKVTDFYGHTVSKRPSASANVHWDKLTMNVPCSYTPSSGTNYVDVNQVYDSGYSFVKSDSELVTIGTSLVKDTNPIQSQVDLLSDIAEAVSNGVLLPELLGKSIVGSVINPKSRRDIIRAIGGEYLNYIFGFKPLADDIAKVGTLIDTVNGIVDQWIKDNGTIVRRRRKYGGSPKTQTDKGWISSGVPGLTLNPAVPGRFFNRTTPVWPQMAFENDTNISQMRSTGFYVSRVSSQITFSAGYEYDLTSLFLPVSGGSAADLMHNSALRGELTAVAFGLDPASIGKAVYDAIPFSWLLDWFVNIGDLIDNFRGLQARGVQLLWGYVTETAIRDFYFEYHLDWTPTNRTFFSSQGICVQKSVRRIRATPFGFGTSFGSLTSSQSATLAALLAAKS